MIMEVNELAEIVRKERASSSFQELGENFYNELRELAGRTFSAHPEYSKERENLKNLISELINAREKKLMKNALSFARSDEEVYLDNTTESEKNALKIIVDALKNNRAEINKIVYSKHCSPKEQESLIKKSPVEPEPAAAKAEVKTALPKSEAKPGIKKVTIAMLSDLPPILGIDGKAYGPFRKEDVIFLPEKNARIFITQGYAKEIK